MTTQRFAVEYDHRTVGIAAPFPRGFMFGASDDDFEEIDGRLFSRARAIERLTKRRRPAGAVCTPSFA